MVKKTELPPNVELETTSCVVCGASAFELLFQRVDLATSRPGLFQMVRCRKCQHQYLNPRPTSDSISFYYPDSYTPYVNPHPSNVRSIWGYWLVTYPLDLRCKLVTRHASSGGRILDVGCSTGQFLGQMAKFGHWERFGVELNPMAAVIARKRYQFSVIVGELEATRFPAEYFHAVTMWDVIEHLHQPLHSLIEVNRTLKCGGHLVLSTPVLDSLDSRLFGKYWVGYELPRHLNIFSRDSLLSLLTTAGFIVQEQRILLGSNYAWLDSLAFWSKGQALSQFWQVFFQQTIRWIPWLIITAPLFKLLDWLQLSTPLTLVCKKVANAK